MEKKNITFSPKNISALRKFLYIVVPLYPVTLFSSDIFDTGYSLVSQLLIIVYICVTLLCATEDIITRTIPDFYNIVIFISGLAFSFDNKGLRNTFTTLLKTTVLFAVLILFFFAAKNGIGGGDIKMIAATSTFIGIINALLAFCLASILALPLCIFLITKSSITQNRNKAPQSSSSHKTDKTKQPLSLPFGPFIAFGILIQISNFF